VQQLRLPWGRAAVRPSRPPAVVVDGRPLPVVVTRHRRARRYLVRVTDDGRIRLTVPARASVGAGVRFVEAQTDWIAGEWRRMRDAACWDEGTPVWYRGVREPLRYAPDGIRVGDLHVVADLTGAGHPQADQIRTLVHTAMRRVATDELVRHTREVAAAIGAEPSRVVVRNQQTRWGSCSSRGVVSLNWRLIQMPPDVSDYVIRHEFVHLAHPDHSRRFWRAVEAICPDWRAGEAWLRRFGQELL